MSTILPVFQRAVVETLRISFPTVVDGLRGAITIPECDARLASWSKKLLDDVEIQLEVHGREHVANREPFILMSNHQSLYDIPVLFQAIPDRSIRMVAKTELFRVPIWGGAMRAASFVEVDRGNRERAIESLKAARATIQGGISIWISPEGTRSPTGKLARFKQGGFHLAIDTQTRILPISIWGTRDTLRKKGWSLQKGARVRVTIHPPVDPQTYGHERRAALVEDVRNTIASELPPQYR